MKKRIKVMKKYFNKKSGLVNEKIKQFFQEIDNNNQLRANKLLGIEDENVSKPLIITTPNLSKASNLKYRIADLGNNKFDVQYNHAIINTIYFGETTIFYHQSAVNFLSGKIEEDFTGEVSLYDIVQVQTSLAFDSKNEEQKVTELSLYLNLIDGDQIVFPLRRHFVIDGYDYPEILTEKENYVINTIKKAVRTLK